MAATGSAVLSESHPSGESVDSCGADGRPTRPDPPPSPPAGQRGSLPRRGRSVRPARAGRSEHHGRAGGRDQNPINREHLQVRNVPRNLISSRFIRAYIVDPSGFYRCTLLDFTEVVRTLALLRTLPGLPLARRFMPSAETGPCMLDGSAPGLFSAIRVCFLVQVRLSEAAR